MLDACRVLDLTDHRGLVCGQILSDLGADVIRAGALGSRPARRRLGAVPALGADNKHALTQILGYDEERVTELVVAGAFG